MVHTQKKKVGKPCSERLTSPLAGIVCQNTNVYGRNVLARIL